MLSLEESQFGAGNAQRHADRLRKVNGQKEQPTQYKRLTQT